MANITLRPETPSDFHEAEWVCQQSFYNEFIPGCAEHYLLHTLRTDPCYVKELTRLAILDGRIVGGIYYLKALIKDGKKETPVLCLGPVFVHPLHQGEGIGKALIEATLEEARKLSYPAAILFGHPTYYPRFGFVDCKKYKITTKDGSNFPAFMAYEIHKGSLKGIEGRFFDSPIFEEATPEKGNEYDKNFPPLEKHAPKHPIG